MTQQFEDMATRDADADCRSLAEGAAPSVFLLVAPRSASDASVVAFDGDEPVTVGRGDAASVQVRSLSLSRLHARFQREGDGVSVTDLGSRNGIWVAGKRVRAATLRDGESTLLGDVIVTVVVMTTVRRPEEVSVVRVSASMIAVQRVVERIGPSSLPVLIVGETGTGKELVAGEVHRHSARRGAAMTVVNCAAIAPALVESILFGHVRGAFTGAIATHKGVFEQATGGTIFLDEVGELSATAQASLLRVLDTGRIVPVGGAAEIDVDVRVVAATHRDLPAMVAEKAFRLDLFHRLNALTIALPPLRERRDEIAPLAAHFAKKAAAGGRTYAPVLAPAALDALLAYEWPGNARELRNVIERALVLGDGETIVPADLPDHVRAAGGVTAASPVSSSPLPVEGMDLRRAVRQHEFSLIRSALERTNGHRGRAARLLKLPLRTLERKVREAATADPKKH